MQPLSLSPLFVLPLLPIFLHCLSARLTVWLIPFVRFPTGIGFGFRYGKGLSAYRFCLLQNALGVRAMGGLHT